MAERVRVLIYHQCADPDAIRAAYEVVSTRLRRVPGLVGNELMASVHDPTGYVVLSEWSDLDAFRRWEESPEHRDDTAPLRPYRDNRLAVPFGVYEVKAAY